MKTTRLNSDPFVTIKIPESLHRKLRVRCAITGKYLYQTIAELMLVDLENNAGKEICASEKCIVIDREARR
jgi:hypothetical protein